MAGEGKLPEGIIKTWRAAEVRFGQGETVVPRSVGQYPDQGQANDWQEWLPVQIA